MCKGHHSNPLFLQDTNNLTETIHITSKNKPKNGECTLPYKVHNEYTKVTTLFKLTKIKLWIHHTFYIIDIIKREFTMYVTFLYRVGQFLWSRYLFIMLSGYRFKWMWYLLQVNILFKRIDYYPWEFDMIYKIKCSEKKKLINLNIITFSMWRY